MKCNHRISIQIYKIKTGTEEHNIFFSQKVEAAFVEWRLHQ